MTELAGLRQDRIGRPIRRKDPWSIVGRTARGKHRTSGEKLSISYASTALIVKVLLP